MNSYPIACIGATSSHGGFIISAPTIVGQIFVDGLQAGGCGGMHSCPIPGHGITPIVYSPISTILMEGNQIAMIGSVAGCGAVIITGSADVNAVGP